MKTIWPLMTLLVACGSPTLLTPESESQAVSVCGTTPKIGVCQTITCNVGDEAWEIGNKPNGTSCTGGACDGNGHCVAIVGPPPPPTPRVIDFQTVAVTTLPLIIKSGVATTIAVQNCSAGTDPVIHFMLGDSATRTFIQTAVAEGTSASLTTTPVGTDGAILIVRANQDHYGTCDIYRDGGLYREAVSVGGKSIDVYGGHIGDDFETVTMPTGRAWQAVYLLSGLNIVQTFASATGGGTGQSVRTQIPAPTTHYLVDGMGPTRVVINDLHSDSDGDGLGDALEAALGTCSSTTGIVAGYDCSQSKTAQDTDGDGLSDAWEVLGKRDQLPHQLLPAWGANPRHKDLFVEMDFLAGSNPVTNMPASAASSAAMIWADAPTSRDPNYAPERAALMRNPDGLPGVAAHFDTGIDPPAGATVAQATLSGNWGGWSQLPAGISYDNAWRQWMTPARFGVFHWVLGAGPGGQTDQATLSSIAQIDNGLAVAHELGHTTGLEHYGLDGFGALNCKPQYASLMNYAYTYTGIGFSGESFPGPLNNTALTEFGNLAAVPDRIYFADLYASVFGYFVDRTTWSVDFDRDGVIAPAGTHVRAAANSMPGGECEGVREHEDALTFNPQTAHTPALVRSAGQIMILTASASNGLVLNAGSDSYATCTGDGTSACGTFATNPSLVAGAGITAVDAVNVSTSTGDTVLFAYLQGTVLRTGAFQTSIFGTAVKLDTTPLFNSASGEPVMIAEGPQSAMLLFKDAGGNLHESQYTVNVGWGPANYASSTLGQSFAVNDSPGLVMGRMPGDTADAMYMQASQNISGTYVPSLLKRNAAGQWAVTSFGAPSSISRPGMAYVPSVNDPSKGKIYSLWVDTNNIFRMTTSGVKITPTAFGSFKTNYFGGTATFDNSDSRGFGADLMFEPGKDTNLRAVTVLNFGTANQKPVFQPIADGIVDLTYSGFDDLDYISLHLCGSIPGNTTIPCW